MDMDIKQSIIDIPSPINKQIQYFYYDNEGSAVVRAVKNKKIWEKKLYDVYKDMIQPTDVILDIGAFIGTHTSLFSCLATLGKVYSFEPCSEPHTCLGLMCNTNDLDNVEIINKAVSDKNTETILGTDFDGSSQLCVHHKRKTLPKRNFKKYQMVQTITIDSLNLTKCDMIKIDVEKHEWKVLEGAKNTISEFRPAIFLETNRFKINILKLENWTTNNFYTYKHLKGDDYLLLSI